MITLWFLLTFCWLRWILERKLSILCWALYCLFYVSLLDVKLLSIQQKESVDGGLCPVVTSLLFRWKFAQRAKLLKQIKGNFFTETPTRNNCETSDRKNGRKFTYRRRPVYMIMYDCKACEHYRTNLLNLAESCKEKSFRNAKLLSWCKWMFLLEKRRTVRPLKFG